MAGLAERVIEKMTSMLPSRIAAEIDRAQPRLAMGFGPFNGQLRREAIVRSILKSFRFDLVIEAGTFRGSTTERLREMTSAPIVTIEISKRYHEYALRRLSGLTDVTVVNGDSAGQIRRLASRRGPTEAGSVFAYLDAHWGSSLPTRYELLELLSGWGSVCAVVDDFKVPGDSGYGYDDYGPGMVVDSTLLEGLPLKGAYLFLPSVRSELETGYRRGWAVVVRGDELAAQLMRTEGLMLAKEFALEFSGNREMGPSDVTGSDVPKE